MGELGDGGSGMGRVGNRTRDEDRAKTRLSRRLGRKFQLPSSRPDYLYGQVAFYKRQVTRGQRQRRTWWRPVACSVKVALVVRLDEAEGEEAVVRARVVVIVKVVVKAVAISASC